MFESEEDFLLWVKKPYERSYETDYDLTRGKFNRLQTGSSRSLADLCALSISTVAWWRWCAQGCRPRSTSWRAVVEEALKVDSSSLVAVLVAFASSLAVC